MTDEPSIQPTLWACGVLGKAHGLRGELYLNLAADGLDHLRLGSRFFLAGRDRQGGGPERPLRPCNVARAGGTDQRPIVLLDVARTRDEALALQGMELLAAGDALEALPHYRVGDLIGARVETAGGRHLGDVDDVLEAPAHEILSVRTPGGSTLLLPLVDDVLTLDAAARLIRVPEGFVDEPSAEATS